MATRQILQPTNRETLLEVSDAELGRGVRIREKGIDFVVRTVPHRKQRYETSGDWIPGDPAEIRVSKLKNRLYVYLIAVHEMTEYAGCAGKKDIDQRSITFDLLFELERKAKLHGPFDEPGDDRRAPYYADHQAATEDEKHEAAKLGVDWDSYEKAVNRLRRN